MEKPGDCPTIQGLIAHGPAHDLPHALHLVEAREVHQHGEAGEKLQSLGKAAEHCQRAGDILVRIDAEGREVIVLVLHLLVLEEHAIFTFRSEEHKSELQSLMRNSYAVFCLKKK